MIMIFRPFNSFINQYIRYFNKGMENQKTSKGHSSIKDELDLITRFKYATTRSEKPKQTETHHQLSNNDELSLVTKLKYGYSRFTEEEKEGGKF